jgi:hypothetical protein
MPASKTTTSRPCSADYILFVNLAGAGFSSRRQLGHANAQALSEPDDVAPGRVTPPVLDMADPALHQASPLGELHLRDANLRTNGLNRSAQGGGIW